MKKCAILLASAGFLAGCASSDMGGSARVSTGHGSGHTGGITPLSEDRSDMEASGSAALSEENRASGEIRTDQRASSRSDSEMVEIPLYREELNVGKRQVSNGGVLLRKVIETENASQPVQLRREEIIIERIQPGDGRAQARSDIQPFQEKETVIELHREVPVAEKRSMVTEVVRARKTSSTERQTIADTVRRESIDIDRDMQQARTDSREDSRAMGGPAANISGSARSDSPQRTEREDAEIRLHKEELQVGKREVPSGRVVLKKEITTEKVSQPIELRSEDVKIERQPASDRSSAQASFQQEEIYIPLTKEVPVKEKEVRLAEVVRAGKRTETEQQNVSAQLRKERIEVIRGERGERREGRIQAEATGAPGRTEAGASRQIDARAGARADLNARQDIDWGDRERFSGTITMLNPETRRVTVRNEQGQTRTFTFSDKPVLNIKENRQPNIVDFKVGYPVTVGHKGDTAEIMVRSDTPEVK